MVRWVFLGEKAGGGEESARPRLDTKTPYIAGTIRAAQMINNKTSSFPNLSCDSVAVSGWDIIMFWSIILRFEISKDRKSLGYLTSYLSAGIHQSGTTFRTRLNYKVGKFNPINEEV